MAPIKLEDNIRDKFEERRLIPSVESWDKLSGLLDEVPVKKRNYFLVYRIAIAAIFIGVIALFWYSVNTVGFVESDIEIVDVESIHKKNSNSNYEAKEGFEEEVIVEENTSKQLVKDVVEKVLSYQKEKIVKGKNLISDKVLIADNKELNIERQKKSSEIVANSLVVEKIEKLLVEVESIEKSGSKVSDAEVDSLLNIAKKELFEERYLNTSKVVVDAASLLDEVENDAKKEKLLKEHIYEALVAGYITAKTIVVDNRDQE